MVLSEAGPAVYKSNFIRSKENYPPLNGSKNKNSGSVLSKESLRVDTLHLSYENSDRTKLGVHIKSVNNKSGVVSVSSQKSERDEIIGYIKDELLEIKKKIIAKLFGEQESEGVGSTGKIETAEEIEAIIPEYWNAENTSQRIVDFALSFFSQHDGDAKEFFELVKASIEEGFRQAKQMLGAVPGAVAKLSEKTYDLTMSKLDAWAKEQGIEV